MREFAFVKKRNASQPVVGYRSMPMPCVHFQQQTRISRILRSSAIQPRLEISQPDDPCEQEADRVADQVMRMFGQLTHVVQESGGPASIIRREEEPTRRQIERDNYLRRLAAWPDEALDAWRRLMPGEQTVVVVYMSGNYGSDFASQFLGYAQSLRRPEPVSHWTNILRESPEELRRHGYRWVVTSMGIEHWVHPSGNSLHRILPSRRSEPRTEPSASSERGPREGQPPQATEEIRENPPHIDPSADPAAAYGPVVQSREGAVIMGQNGRAVEHEDGTILLYPDGARTPVTYRPSPGGYNAYEYYGQDGTKFENLIVAIDPENVFGVGEDR
ncbi:MAG: hypothetical protein VB050_14565 [Geobacteraceae bacterium]|nr:hypothetical protein [Geobacteraceae bacterium]